MQDFGRMHRIDESETCDRGTHLQPPSGSTYDMLRAYDRLYGEDGMLERAGRGDERVVLQAWGATIRQYRQWKRLSRREMAQRAGLSPVFLGEIERGEKDPSSHTLYLIASA